MARGITGTPPALKEFEGRFHAVEDDRWHSYRIKRSSQSRENSHLLSASWNKLPMIGRRRGWGSGPCRDRLV